MQEERRVLTVRRRIAAPAPQPERDRTRKALPPPEVEALLWSWADWCRTRKYYGAPDQRLLPVLGRLRVKSTAPRTGPGIAAGGLVPHFHQAVLGLPERERVVLEVHYIHRAKPIKRVADLLGVSRCHYYYVLNGAARTAYERSLVLQRRSG